MTKALARQRAYYKVQLDRWKMGLWTPPKGWAQMVANRFPDLIERYRDEVLGKERADVARTEHRIKIAPKVGDILTAPGVGRVVLTKSNPFTKEFGVARATRWNVFVVKAFLFIKRIFQREK